jgi:hypothetical protein
MAIANMMPMAAMNHNNRRERSPGALWGRPQWWQTVEPVGSAFSQKSQFMNPLE